MLAVWEEEEEEVGGGHLGIHLVELPGPVPEGLVLEVRVVGQGPGT